MGGAQHPNPHDIDEQHHEEGQRQDIHHGEDGANDRGGRLPVLGVHPEQRGRAAIAQLAVQVQVIPPARAEDLLQHPHRHIRVGRGARQHLLRPFNRYGVNAPDGGRSGRSRHLICLKQKVFHVER